MFRTEFTIPPASQKISMASSVLTMGSCFADVIGNHLKNNKLNAISNPFGTLFSPIALSKILTMALKNEAPSPTLFLQNQGLFWHYDCHSSLVGKTMEELQTQITERCTLLRESLKNKAQSADFLLLTFGSAFAYQHIESGEYVANCHKMPASLFRKELLSVKHICQVFGLLYKLLKTHNPHLQLVLTVSPVRHTRDGIPENQVSKSILRAACHYLVSDYEDISYFPSYELMMDDLRDYRFYAPDMIHPNEVAEQYIIQKFSETYFDKNLQRFVAQWQDIQKALGHRPFNEKTEAHQQFLQKLWSDLKALENTVSVAEELAWVEGKMIG